jgi:DNA polymerase-3 subunit chi
MPRADFYLIDKPRFRDAPLRLVCVLARKAFDAEQPALILVQSLGQAEALDDELWAFEPDAFVPHQIAGNEEDELTPILIVPPEVETPDRPLVINLRDGVVARTCERVLEVVPADPAAREGSRRRWSEYKARGYTLEKHDM